MSVAIATTAALLLDAAWGEPRRLHPLVGFGRWAGMIERVLHADRRTAGVLAWCVVVAPLVALVAWAVQAAQAYSAGLGMALSAVLLYLTVGHRSLWDHARPIADALEEGDLPRARTAVAQVVSRDTSALDATQVAGAASESVLENGCDAVFGALFWFVLLGAPGAVAYRLANTLDAMWGYRTPRYARFGWAAARIDDGLNLVPARLTAATYALCGDTRRAWRSWKTQARAWKSPNAGPVMAAGAGAIGVRLGGAAPYHGTWTQRPALGEGAPPDASTIRSALRLVRHGVFAWLAALWLATALSAVLEAWHA
ncbi:adenosylcobinamide-phosphate synthase CbiB [Aerolutibacter ruishenii]|uniref:Cobalamin biosynthesis protein CobD n=1 Tax=Aerolutibacter ruishenii TaxID=686800 RepID=A0A562M2Q9_9GAMM|nr:adenosylcobinamide-phosphate synthase CbiB [Lysobacter ruishenii]TWI14143.1 adenosylcobinamide-phosphate synthase [Lysobacter ruishenii]